MAYSGSCNMTAAVEVDSTEMQLDLWRCRWQQYDDALIWIKYNESQATIHRRIDQTLSDAPRIGSLESINDERFAPILGVAREARGKSGKSAGYRANRETAEMVINRTVASIIFVD